MQIENKDGGVSVSAADLPITIETERKDGKTVIHVEATDDAGFPSIDRYTLRIGRYIRQHIKACFDALDDLNDKTLIDSWCILIIKSTLDYMLKNGQNSMGSRDEIRAIIDDRAEKAFNDDVRDAMLQLKDEI